MKFSVKEKPLAVAPPPAPMTVEQVSAAYEDLMSAYEDLTITQQRLDEVRSVMENVEISMQMIRKCGENALEVLNYDNSLVSLMGISIDKVTSESTLEALNQQGKNLFQRFLDGIKAFFRAIGKFVLGLIERIKLLFTGAGAYQRKIADLQSQIERNKADIKMLNRESIRAIGDVQDKLNATKRESRDKINEIIDRIEELRKMPIEPKDVYLQRLNITEEKSDGKYSLDRLYSSDALIAKFGKIVDTVWPGDDFLKKGESAVETASGALNNASESVIKIINAVKDGKETNLDFQKYVDISRELYSKLVALRDYIRLTPGSYRYLKDIDEEDDWAVLDITDNGGPGSGSGSSRRLDFTGKYEDYIALKGMLTTTRSEVFNSMQRVTDKLRQQMNDQMKKCSFYLDAGVINSRNQQIYKDDNDNADGYLLEKEISKPETATTYAQHKHFESNDGEVMRYLKAGLSLLCTIIAIERDLIYDGSSMGKAFAYAQRFVALVDSAYANYYKSVNDEMRKLIEFCVELKRG